MNRCVGAGASAGPRVLILSADVGEGHLAAARALLEALLERGVPVAHEDGLRCMGPLVRWLVRDGYRGQLRTASWTYNLVYRCWRHGGPLRWIGARVLYRAGRRRLAGLIATHRPNVVVSTHPALTAALGQMRRRRELDAVVCATITDLTANPMWCDRGADLHLVMHPVAIPWVERHAGRGSAVASALLVSARFRAPRDVAAARALLGLPEHGSLVVVSGGGWGVGLLAEGVQAALSAGAGDVVVLAGRNPQVREQLERRFGDDGRVMVMGFTDRMPELLAAATAIVHGTGGVTSLEAIASGCPLIAYGTRLAHVREHNRALAALGLCVVPGDGDELQAEIAARVLAAGRTAEAVTGVRSPAPVTSALAEDAADIVLGACARVRPVPGWVLRVRRSGLTLAATVTTMWTAAAVTAPATTSTITARAVQPAAVIASRPDLGAPSSRIVATAVDPRSRLATAASTSPRPRATRTPPVKP